MKDSVPPFSFCTAEFEAPFSCRGSTKQLQCGAQMTPHTAVFWTDLLPSTEILGSFLSGTADHTCSFHSPFITGNCASVHPGALVKNLEVIFDPSLPLTLLLIHQQILSVFALRWMENMPTSTQLAATQASHLDDCCSLLPDASASLLPRPPLQPLLPVQ